MLLQTFPPAIIRSRMLKLQSLPRNRNRHASGVQFRIHAEIQRPLRRRRSSFILAGRGSRRLPRHGNDLRALALNALQRTDCRHQIVQRDLLSRLINHALDAPTKYHRSTDLKEVPPVASQLHRSASAGIVVAKHIFGDEEHAVEFGGHGWPCLARIVENRGFENGGPEAEEFVVEILSIGIGIGVGIRIRVVE